MKKFILIFSIIVMLFASTMIQVRKAEAFFPAVIPAGAGAYTLIALGGAALLYGLGQEGTAEDLEKHANNVWNKTSSGFKDLVNSSWKWVRNNAGVEELHFDPSAYTITQQDLLINTAKNVTTDSAADISVRNYESTATKTFTNHASHLVGSQVETMYPEGLRAYIYGSGSTSETYRLTTGYGAGLWYFKIDTPTRTYYSSTFDLDSNKLKTINTALVSSSGTLMVISEYTELASSSTGESWFKLIGNQLLTPEQLIERSRSALSAIGVSVSVVSGDFILAQHNYRSKVQEQWESMRDAGLVIDGAGIKAANPDKTFHSDGTITDTATGAQVRPGDLSIPRPIVTDTGRIAVPVGEGTLQDTLTGDKTTTGEGTVPGEGTDTGILQGLWDWLKGILQSILDAIKSIPGALTGLLQSIIDAVKAVAGAVVSGLSGSLQAIIDAINAVKAFLGTMAIAIANAIGALFLPSEGYFTTFFTDIYNLWSSKIPFIIQLKEFFQSIKEVGSGATLPKIEVDLPERYGGVTMSVIDFSYFEEYRDWILNFIRFTAWFIFLKRLYARIPKVVGG